jgi:hypothetical protein
MRRLVPLGLLALALPAAASANTQWFYERQLIAPGEIAEVASKSTKLALTLKAPKQKAVKIPCSVGGVEAFWNTPKNGMDETRSIGFSCSAAPCGKATVTPVLPWGSTLLDGPLPLIDRWEGVTLELTCGGVDYGTFTGSLDAKVGDVDPPGKDEGKDDLDNTIAFKGGVNKPHLRAPNGDLLWFTGFYRLGDKGTGVSDESGT